MKLYNKPIFLYDVECCRNIFTVTFCNSETENVRTYEISKWKNEVEEIVKVFKNEHIVFAGYNCHKYDDELIYTILTNPSSDELNYLLLCKSKELIYQDDANRQKIWDKGFVSIDLMTLLFSSKLRVGLKELQVTLQYPNVEEFDWSVCENDILPEKYRQTLIDYNVNDVLSTKWLLNKLKDAIDLRIEINRLYGVNVLSKDGMKIGQEILKQAYIKELGITMKQLNNIPNTSRDYVQLKDCILKLVKFEDKTLQTLLETMKKDAQYFDEDGHTKDYSYSVKFSNKVYHIGSGGLHSDDEPCIYRASSKKKIIDFDVGSYYPSLIIEHKFTPEHLGKNLLNVYKDIYKQRLKAKKQKKKVEAETLKLALNGTFGQLLQKYSWLYDPKAALSVTINGQLMLLMLVEQLTNAGIEVISANTDGVTTYVDVNKIGVVQQVCDNWQVKTKMNLERTDYDAIFRRDVNSYIAIYEGYYDAMSDKERKKMCKVKGFFKTEAEIGRGLSPLIIPKAIFQYFVHQIPFKETVMGTQDIHDFLAAQKIGRNFEIYWGAEKMQRINRFYVCKPNTGHYLVKKDPKTGKEISLYNEWPVYILNKIDEKPLKDRNIDYRFYLSECRQMIDKIENKQLKLF